MDTIRGYRRETDGTLTIIDLLDDDGTPCYGGGYPLTRTEETVELQGWPDGHARVYKTDGGVEVLVPEDPSLPPTTEDLYSCSDTGFAAAVIVARECGAEAARQSCPPIPDWTCEPIPEGDWDAIQEALGGRRSVLDAVTADAITSRELLDAWLAGYRGIQGVTIEHDGVEYRVILDGSTAEVHRLTAGLTEQVASGTWDGHEVESDADLGDDLWNEIDLALIDLE